MKKSTKSTQYFQQGDCLLFPVPSVPAKAERVTGNVLREGEATGHAHRAVEADVALSIVNGQLYMRAPSGATVRHEEHMPVTVPPGDYLIGAVREYDHFSEEAREVRD